MDTVHASALLAVLKRHTDGCAAPLIIFPSSFLFGAGQTADIWLLRMRPVGLGFDEAARAAPPPSENPQPIYDLVFLASEQI